MSLIVRIAASKVGDLLAEEQTLLVLYAKLNDFYFVIADYYSLRVHVTVLISRKRFRESGNMNKEYKTKVGALSMLTSERT